MLLAIAYWLCFEIRVEVMVVVDLGWEQRRAIGTIRDLNLTHFTLQKSLP